MRFRHIHLLNRKSVGARIWDIPLKKDASSRDPRSIAACEFARVVKRSTFNIFVSPQDELPIAAFGQVRVCRAEQGRVNVIFLFFVRQLVVVCRLTAVVSAASLNCGAAGPNLGVFKSEHQAGVGYAGVLRILPFVAGLQHRTRFKRA